MLLFPLALVAGILLGQMRGGSLGSLAALRVRVPALVGLAVILQVGVTIAGVTADARLVALVTSYGLIGVWLAYNLRRGPRWFRAGLALVAIGYALNLLVIVPNAGMPVSVPAISQAGGTPTALRQGVNLDKHVASARATFWPWLGDVIAIRALRVVISGGDIVMLVGIGVVLSEGMRNVGSSASAEDSVGHDVQMGVR
jgi:Family of unknown function (DUF5317)